MDEGATGGGVRFDGEPYNPLSGRSGYVHELLAELSDDQVGEYCRYWTWHRGRYRKAGDGFSVWKSSNQLSAGYREAKRRGLDIDVLRGSVEETPMG